MKQITTDRTIALTGEYLEIIVDVNKKYIYKGEYLDFDEIKYLHTPAHFSFALCVNVPDEYRTMRINEQIKEKTISRKEYLENSKTNKYLKVKKVLIDGPKCKNEALQTLTIALANPTLGEYTLLKEAYDSKVQFVKSQIEKQIKEVEDDYRFSEIYKEELKTNLKNEYSDFEGLGLFIENIKEQSLQKENEKTEKLNSNVTHIKGLFLERATKALATNTAKQSLKIAEKEVKKSRTLILEREDLKESLDESKNELKGCLDICLDELVELIDEI